MKPLFCRVTVSQKKKEMHMKSCWHKQKSKAISIKSTVSNGSYEGNGYFYKMQIFLIWISAKCLTYILIKVPYMMTDPVKVLLLILVHHLLVFHGAFLGILSPVHAKVSQNILKLGGLYLPVSSQVQCMSIFEPIPYWANLKVLLVKIMS